ncbi:exo-beta-N-acetylmuramidase NamZ family protein, partial [Clostridium perfringens]|uniref:exo-beta-N-acetylmuramidase NamZ family protein n=1 Tax=Clostridium perfringens TaxID=1502 RepID=UPI002ACD85C6
GIDSNFKSSIDVLYENTNLTTLFAAEHGIRGYAQAGDSVGSEVDNITGLPVHSLYGSTKKPTPEMLENVDILAYDMQDVGARFYTYINTLAYAMEACAENDKTFVVFDRPNPIGGEVQGNLLNTNFSSFVGMYPIVQRYGMTVGEYSKFINEEFNINCKLEVVEMEGWTRDMYYDETGLNTWVMPSPNMPTLTTSIVYTGTCVFEGTNVSEGRGTTRPFELIGAPWIDPMDLSNELNSLGLPGVKFRAASFTPTFSKYSASD